MEKVSQIPKSPMDFFLFPAWIHRKISFRFSGLFIAFGFVGLFDIVFFDNVFNTSVFKGDMGSVFIKIVLLAVLALIVGAIDVVCTMYPMADFAKLIGKRSEKFVHKKIAIILMKSYAISHLLFVVPCFFLVYSGVDFAKVGPMSTNQARILFAVINSLLPFLPFFQLGVLYRTLSIRTRIQVFGKNILILAIYFWMGISGKAVLFFNSIAFQILSL